MEKLHPGAKWLFRISGLVGAIFVLFFLSWFLFPLIGILGSTVFGASTGAIIGIVIIGFVIYVALAITIAEIYARMAYNRWFYEFTPHNLKLERGVIWKKYSNVPYERIQNVDIHRGILARVFGFSTVDIQTAGFHFSGRRGGARSEGHIPAVAPEKAEKIREFVMSKITKKGREQGL